MLKCRNIIAVFFALLIIFLQTGYGNPTLDAPETAVGKPATSCVLQAVQSNQLFTFSDQQNAFQTLVNRLIKNFSGIESPDWIYKITYASNASVMNCRAYLTFTEWLPFHSLAPLITFPFHYFY